jgi:hypothetical protein
MVGKPQLSFPQALSLGAWLRVKLKEYLDAAKLLATLLFLRCMESLSAL